MSARLLSEREASIWVNTYKEGLLSSVAHNLQLSLGRFTLKLDAAEAGEEGLKVELRFWPESLSVEGTLDDAGTLNRRGLDRLSKAKVKRSIQKEVLKTKKNPLGLFAGTLRDDQLTGQLTLLGRQQPVTATLCENDGRWTGSAEIQPSRWGIAPYQALLGAIKLQDRVQIHWSVPAE